jgi:hypothetical protein
MAFVLLIVFLSFMVFVSGFAGQGGIHRLASKTPWSSAIPPLLVENIASMTSLHVSSTESSQTENSSSKPVEYPQPKPFLSTLLSSRSSKEEKLELLSIVRKLRQRPDSEGNKFMDSLLLEIDSVSANDAGPITKLLTARRFPLPLPSYRAKLGAAVRVLECLMQSDTEKKTKEDQVGIICYHS